MVTEYQMFIDVHLNAWMQMVINLAPVSLSNRKVNFYTWPRLTEEKCHGKCLQEHFWASTFQTFLGGNAPRPSWLLAPSALETCLVLFGSLATALIRGRLRKKFNRPVLLNFFKTLALFQGNKIGNWYPFWDPQTKRDVVFKVEQTKWF